MDRLQRGPLGRQLLEVQNPYLPNKCVCPCWSRGSGLPPWTHRLEVDSATGGRLLSQAWKHTDPQSCSHAALASGAGEGHGAGGGGCKGTALHPQQSSLTARGLQPLLPPSSAPLEALSPFRPQSCPLGGGVHQASPSAFGLDSLRLPGGTHVISCP